MTEIQLLDEFTQTLAPTYPNETTATLAGVLGMELHFTAPIEVTANSWEAAVVEFTSGDCQGLSFVIAESAGQVVILTSPFYRRKPQAGDTVRIYGGPLAELRIFHDDPETLKEAVESGVKFYATAAVVAGSTGWKGLGGRSHKGVEATYRIFGIEVTLETKLTTGLPTEADMYREYVALPILKEQVNFLIQAFRVDAQNRLSGEGNIEWNRGFLQRPGNAAMRVYVINFDVAVN